MLLGGLLAAETLAAAETTPTAKTTAPVEVQGTPCCRKADMWLVSTRCLSCNSDPHEMRIKHRDATGHWRVASWDAFFEGSTDGGVTVFYIHGNRTDPGSDIQQGWTAHNALMRYGSPTPVRFVIWAWPASQIRGPIKDVRVKAARTAVDSRFLAWTLAKLPVKTPTSLVGFSYGARIAAGALHLLGGGELNGRRLEALSSEALSSEALSSEALSSEALSSEALSSEALSSEALSSEALSSEEAAATKKFTSPRVVLIAGAMHNYWLNPQSIFGRALSQTDQMLITMNPRDHVLKHYRLITPYSNPQALGYTGLACPWLLGDARDRIQVRNVSAIVGREHSNVDIWRSGLAREIQRYAFWLPVE